MTAKYSSEIRITAKKLRGYGYSYAEIAAQLQVPRGTIRSWVYDVALQASALQRLAELRSANREKALQVQESLRFARKTRLKLRVATEVQNHLAAWQKSDKKIWCALLFWAEGSKSGSALTFTNSDPAMIRLFLYLLRAAFTIDERKLRVLLHTHDYHDTAELQTYWSSVTGIPESQFNRSYTKPNTGINKRLGYKGTARIRYYDVRIAQELTALYNTLAEIPRGVG